MKVDLLKKLIKEAVKEGIKEELREILTELIHPTPEKTISEKNQFTAPPKPVDTDPLSKMINMTKSSMVSEDYTNILNFQSSDAKNFLSNSSSQTLPTPGMLSKSQPGLDISNLDFVKKASSVYQASLQKDKQKNFN